MPLCALLLVVFHPFTHSRSTSGRPALGSYIHTATHPVSYPASQSREQLQSFSLLFFLPFLIRSFEHWLRNGLCCNSITSDTVCRPTKLAELHMRCDGKCFACMSLDWSWSHFEWGSGYQSERRGFSHNNGSIYFNRHLIVRRGDGQLTDIGDTGK